MKDLTRGDKELDVSCISHFADNSFDTWDTNSFTTNYWNKYFRIDGIVHSKRNNIIIPSLEDKGITREN